MAPFDPAQSGHELWIESMTERYRLLFRGEILDGQHKAVVKKRLSGVLKTDPDQIENLFSGDPVVIKKDVDRRTAARYQAAFKEAGARLRVVEIAGRRASPEAGASEAAATATAAEASEGAFTVAEPGALLTDGEGVPAPEPPDTSHLSVAELGVDLVELERLPVVEVEIDPNWDLAEPGADLGQIRGADVEIDVVADFSLAPPGADMDERQRPPPPAAPDTSHLSVEEVDDG